MTDQIQQQAADPRTPGETLARIAYERPDLRATVAGNPAAYPELLTWLGAFGDPHVDAAIAARRAAPGVAPAVGAPHQAPAQAWGQQPQAGGQQAWGQQPQAGGQQAWGQQPQPGAAAWEGQASGYSYGADAPGVVSYDSGIPVRRSRRGLVVGGAVAAGVLVLGGGAWAAKTLIFDKISGSSTPEEAVVKLVDSAAEKDILAMYGSLSPAEVSHLKTQYDSFAATAEGNEEYGSLLESYQSILDAVSLDVTGLNVSSESIGDGVAKVYVTDGKFTLDGDSEKLATEVSELFSEIAASNLSGGMMGQLPPLEFPDEAEMKAEIKKGLDESLPATADVKDLEASGEQAFVVAVEEEGAWFVSPYLTIAEYVLDSTGGTRGTLPAASSIKTFDSPTAAASGLVDAAIAYAKSGNPHDLAVALPLAERRLASMYLPSHDGTDLAGLSLESNTFAERSKDGSSAKVVFDKFALTVTEQGATSRVTLDGSCFSLDMTGMGSGTICLDQAPLLKDMGMHEASLVAQSEGGSWFLSPISTFVDASTLMGDAMLKLQQEGKLDDDVWITEQSTALMQYVQQQPVFAMLGAAAPFTPGGFEDELSFDDLGDASLGQFPSEGEDPFGDSTGELTAEEIAGLLDGTQQ